MEHYLDRSLLLSCPPRGTQSAPELEFDITITDEEHARLAERIIDKLLEIPQGEAEPQDGRFHAPRIPPAETSEAPRVKGKAARKQRKSRGEEKSSKPPSA